MGQRWMSCCRFSKEKLTSQTDEEREVKEARGLSKVKVKLGENAMRFRSSGTLQGYLPCPMDAKTHWRDFLIQLEQRANSSDNGGGTPFRIITNERSSRRRYAKSYEGKHDYLGPVWSIGMSLYLDLLPVKDKKGIEIKGPVTKIFELLNLKRIKDETLLKWTFSELDIVAKKWGDILFPGYWRYLTYWGTLGDYVDGSEHTMEMIDLKKMEDELRDWVQEDRNHDNGSWYDMFEEECWNFLANAPNAGNVLDEDVPSLDEYCEGLGYHGRSGSTHHDSKIQLEEDGKKFSSGKNKWTTALKGDRMSRKKAILTRKEPLYRIIYKREAKKIRPVVGAPDYLFSQMDFISQWLDQAMRGYDISTLFMNSREAVQMWRDLCKKCGMGYVCVPLDQTNFDHQATLPMLRRAFRQLKRFIALYAPKKVRAEYLEVMGIIISELTEDRGGLIFGEKLIEVFKGILSGWRWTAFLDTLFNYAEIKTAQRLLALWGFDSVGPVSLKLQGDDDDVMVLSYGEAVGLVLAYIRMGIPVNKNKFFIDQYRDEFLRKYIERGMVSGYPARGINAVLWAGPLSRSLAVGETRMRDQFKAWNALIARGMSEHKCMKHAYVDISRGNAISKKLIKRWFHTPALFGGLGLRPLCLDWVKVSDSRRINTWSVGEKLRGLESECVKYGLNQDDTDVRRKLQTLIPTSRGGFDVVESKVEVLPYLIPKWDGTRGMPVQTSPRWIHHKDILLEIWVDRCVSARRFDLIDGAMHRESRVWSKMIRNKSIAVWRDWIRDKLPTIGADIVGRGDLQMSVVAEEKRKRALGYWINKYGHHADYHLLKRCLLRAEEEAIWEVTQDSFTFSN
jgi:hypothetical protein